MTVQTGDADSPSVPCNQNSIYMSVHVIQHFWQIRVAKEVDIPEIQNGRDVADRLDKLHSSQLEPLLLPTHPGGPCEPTKLLQLDEEEKTCAQSFIVRLLSSIFVRFLQTQLEAAKPKLLKMFKFYAGGDKDVSCLEFLRFAKECGSY